MRSTWTHAASTQEHAFFSKLPPEMRDQILSHLPETEVSALRKYCQELHDIVAAYESHHAPLQVSLQFHMRRLQIKIDAIKNTSLPTDSETLLAGLKIWTSTRGVFEDSETSLHSLEKWFSHLAGDRVKSEYPQPFGMFETWALVAMQAVRLQTRLESELRINGIKSPHETHWASFRTCLSSINNLPLCRTEIRALYDRIRGDDLEDLDNNKIKPQIHITPKEHTTFPGNGKNKFRLSPIRAFVGRPDNPKGRIRDSVYPAKVLCGYLGLPELPGSNTFCYCVKQRWVTELLQRRYKNCKGAEEMSPSMKERVLQWVEIF